MAARRCGAFTGLTLGLLSVCLIGMVCPMASPTPPDDGGPAGSTPNQAPVISEGSSAAMRVQADSDCNGTGNQLVLTAADTDNALASLTWNLTVVPVHGTARFVGESSGQTVRVCYTPDPGQSHADTFTVGVSDPSGGTASIRVDVTVNTPPQIAQGSNAAMRVQANSDCSGAGNQLALTAADPDNALASLAWSLTVLPVHGTAGFVGGLSGQTVSVCYTPDPRQYQADAFAVRVSDPSGGTATIAVDVTVNIPPQIAQGPTSGLTVQKNTACPTNTNNRIQLTATDPDGGISALAWSIETAPATGTATFLGGTTGGAVTICYQPTAGQSADDSFVAKVRDCDGATSTITVNVDVQNASPVIIQGPSKTTAVWSSSDCPNTGNQLAVDAADPDDAASALTWSTKTAPAHGTVSYPGSQTGGTTTVCYKPTGGYAGSDNFVVQVDDGAGGADDIAITVDVVARPQEGTWRWQGLAVVHLPGEATVEDLTAEFEMQVTDGIASGRPTEGPEPAVTLCSLTVENTPCGGTQTRMLLLDPPAPVTLPNLVFDVGSSQSPVLLYVHGQFTSATSATGTALMEFYTLVSPGPPPQVELCGTAEVSWTATRTK